MFWTGAWVIRRSQGALLSKRSMCGGTSSLSSISLATATSLGDRQVTKLPGRVSALPSAQKQRFLALDREKPTNRSWGKMRSLSLAALCLAAGPKDSSLRMGEA